MLRSDHAGKQYAATCCLHVAAYSPIIAKEIARCGGVPMLIVVRQHGEPRAKARATLALEKLMEFGYRMNNLDQHNLDPELLEDLMNPKFNEESEEEESEEEKPKKEVPVEIEEVS